MAEDPLEQVRRGYEAAQRGDLDVIAAMLSPEVRWHGAGDDGGGCQNRKQTLKWMRKGLGRGARVDLLEARRLTGDRVLVLLRRREPGEPGEAPEPHGQIIHFRDGLITDMVVYPTAAEALAAAGEN
jgi:ketosteroid isomerase-like protein